MPPIPATLTTLTPFWSTTDGNSARLYLGDVLATLRNMPARSIQMAVTSPPYWALRDYGTGKWEGGSPACDHIERTAESCHKTSTLGANRKGHPVTNAAYQSQVTMYKDVCKKCGAKRVDHQLGSEALHDCGQLEEVGDGLFRRSNCAERDWRSACHVCRMVLVGRELRRVLRDDGTFWMNYGDTYCAGNNRNGLNSVSIDNGTQNNGRKGNNTRIHVRRPKGLPGGNLAGVPWRVALAMQADGWILRQEIIWHKLSPLPESVRNRCTKSHEHIFLLTKQQNYYYDMESIREKTGREMSHERYEEVKKLSQGKKWFYSKDGPATSASGKSDNPMAGDKGGSCHPDGKNKRSVWALSSQGYPGAHFATYPEKLIEPCILAGTSAKGACLKCGAPWERILSRTYHGSFRNDGCTTTGPGRNGGDVLGSLPRDYTPPKTVGWQPTCTCNGHFVEQEIDDIHYGSWNDGEGLPDVKVVWKDGNPEPRLVKRKMQVYVPRIPIEQHPIRPCIVFDPFIGSGTTIVVALNHGRWGWGIDLSDKYLRENAVPRIEGRLRSLGKYQLMPGYRPAAAVRLNGARSTG